MPEALPAVVTPSLNSGRNYGERRHIGAGAGMFVFRPPRPARRAPPGTSTEIISPAKNPSALAAAYLLCEPAANVSARLARDLVVARQIVGGFGHRIGTVAALDLRVRETRSDRQVEHPEYPG